MSNKVVVFKKNSAEHHLANLMIESRFKILESNLIKEGFFDDFSAAYKKKKSEMAREKEISKNQKERDRQTKKTYRDQEKFDKRMSRIRRERIQAKRREQDAKEAERLRYIRNRLPIPDGSVDPDHNLTKKALRKYYEKNNMPIPEFLQGEEERTDPRAEEDKDTLISRFSDMLGLHPEKEKKLRRDIKKVGGGVKATGNFLGNLYKKLTGTSFLPATGDIEVNPNATDQNNQNIIGSFGSDLLAGIPPEFEMWYLWFRDFKNHLVNKSGYVEKLKNDSSNTVDTNDLEAVAESFINNELMPRVLTPDFKDVKPAYFRGAKTKWKDIYNSIKESDNENDKSDFKKYLSGHFFVSKDVNGNAKLQPIGFLVGIKEEELK